jgi:sugar (pentulose or hexulose) kinase
MAAWSILKRLLHDLPPGAGGLLLVPYWNTAMNPYWDASASGIVAGWRGYHRPEHLYQAILEGIGYELRLSIEGVQKALPAPVEYLIATGGRCAESRLAADHRRYYRQANLPFPHP